MSHRSARNGARGTSPLERASDPVDRRGIAAVDRRDLLPRLRVHHVRARGPQHHHRQHHTRRVRRRLAPETARPARDRGVDRGVRRGARLPGRVRGAGQRPRGAGGCERRPLLGHRADRLGRRVHALAPGVHPARAEHRGLRGVRSRSRVARGRPDRFLCHRDAVLRGVPRRGRGGTGPLFGSSRAPGAARTATTERVIALSMAGIALACAFFVAFAVQPDSAWAPAVALAIVGIVALTHVLVIGGTNSPSGIRALGLVIAGLGGVAVATIGIAIALRADRAAVDASSAVNAALFWPAVVAATAALALEAVGRRMADRAMIRPARVAAFAAAAVAALAVMIPACGALFTALTAAGSGYLSPGAASPRTRPWIAAPGPSWPSSLSRSSRCWSRSSGRCPACCASGARSCPGPPRQSWRWPSRSPESSG